MATARFATPRIPLPSAPDRHIRNASVPAPPPSSCGTRLGRGSTNDELALQSTPEPISDARPTSIAHTKRILFLCGGPDTRPDSLLNLALAAGLQGHNFDTANGPTGDLADSFNFDRIIDGVKAGEYSAVFASPECGPFSRLHNLPGPGGPPLTTATGPERYGRKDLAPATYERVRTQILVCVRVAKVLKLCTEMHIPFLFETAGFHEGRTSVFNLDEYVDLRANPDVQHTRGVQCPFGALSSKSTSFLHFHVNMADMPDACPHRLRNWYSDRDNTMIVSRHPRTRGKTTYSRTMRTTEQMQQWRPTGFVSATLAAYPPLLNRCIIAKLRIAMYQATPILLSARGLHISDAAAATDRGHVDKRARLRFSERITWLEPLRGAIQPTDKETADAHAIGGLRNAADSVGRLHRVAEFGRALGTKLKALLTGHPSWITDTCDAIGSTTDLRPPPDAVAAVRNLLCEATHMTAADSSLPRLTDVDAHLLEAWRLAAGDPDDQVGPWLKHGSPAGIEAILQDPGIFPPCSKPAEMEPLDLHCDMQTFQNYPGVEEQAITDAELTAHLGKGHIIAFDTKAELAEYVGGPPILNKLGLIIKIRNGIKKARMILDTKASGVKAITTQAQRINLPRLFDAIIQILVLLTFAAARLDTGIDVESFVLDFSDAYYQIPIHRSEQRYFCATGRIRRQKRYIAFLRAAQGSSAAGTLWARLAALLMRLTQSIADPSELRLACYVDDPIAAVSGTAANRQLLIAMMILLWEALGFRLAYAKGQRGRTVTWIGGTLVIGPQGVTATVKDSIIDDIVADINAFLATNLVSKKKLHSLLGKLNHAAGLLITIRPFLDEIWAAWAAPSPPGHIGCVWTKQFRTSLLWFHTLFTGKGRRIERYFSLDSFNRVGTRVEIGTDASPWGMGGWLAIDGRITKYFATAISAHDIKKYNLIIGEARGQQLWEALAILVAIDMWTSEWHRERIVLEVRSDNVAALTLLTKMRPPAARDDKGDRVPNTTMAVVARELAMRLVDFSFPPDAKHTPGIGHILADRLSRIYSPTGLGRITMDLHPALAAASETTAPIRDDKWYQT